MRGHAVVAMRPREVEFREIELPEPGAEDVVIHVTHSWISNGTEGSFIRGERIAGDTPLGPTDPLPFPHVPGYQKVGVVDWVGTSVPNIQRGETVFATVSAVTGMFFATGGHVSPAITHHSQIWKLPPGLEPLAAAGLTLAQVGYNCGQRPALAPGDCAVVIGDGMVGHWAAQTLQHRGARVMMAGRHSDRLRLFHPGPDGCAINVRESDVLEVARAWAGDGKAQVLVDTVGSVPAIEALYPVMRHGGQIVTAGFHGPRGLIDIQPLRNRELSIHAPAGWSRDRMDATLALLSQGALRTLPLLTHRFPVRRAAEAYGLILNRIEPVLGVILDWGE